MSWTKRYLELIDAEALAVNATVNFLAENRFLCHKRQVNSNWKIHLPVNWEDYTRLLSKSLRKRCKKLQKQFLDSGEIVVRQVEKEEDLPEGWKVLLKLHTDRWKNDLKPLGIFSDERFLAFHKKVSSILFRQGKLRLAWLEHNNIPLAVEYQFMGSKTLYAYQAGIDLSNDLFSVGKLSIMTSIQFAILNGCVFFDLLNGNDPYKLNWRATPVDCHDFRVWHNRGMGRLEWGLWSSYSLAVHYLKPILPHRFIISMLTALHKSKDFVRLRFKKTQAA